jgi:hypothetical protein
VSTKINSEVKWLIVLSFYKTLLMVQAKNAFMIKKKKKRS